MPATPEEWAARMLDATRNGLAVKHPEAFIQWLDALSEPRFMTALATMALDPESYPKALGRGIDPEAARSWSEFADPNLYLRWMLAGMDGRFYSAILSRVASPEKMGRWVNFATRPEACAPFMKILDPATSVAWASAFAGGVARQIMHDDDGQWLRMPEPFLSSQGKPPRTLPRY